MNFKKITTLSLMSVTMMMVLAASIANAAITPIDYGLAADNTAWQPVLVAEGEDVELEPGEEPPDCGGEDICVDDEEPPPPAKD